MTVNIPLSSWGPPAWPDRDLGPGRRLPRL